jgi:hypothetical protein
VPVSRASVGPGRGRVGKGRIKIKHSNKFMQDLGLGGRGEGGECVRPVNLSTVEKGKRP